MERNEASAAAQAPGRRYRSPRGWLRGISEEPGKGVAGLCRRAGRSRRIVGVSVVYRDERGVEYVSVPLPTHEVTEAVPIDAHRLRRRSQDEAPFYAGTDGARLAAQPRGQRKHWSDEQWVAFKEFQTLESELAREDQPVAAAVIVKMR